MERLPLLAVGDLMVVLVAFVTAVYHLVLYGLWTESRDRFWAGMIAAGAGIYSAGSAALYIVDDWSLAPTFQRLIIVGGALICHAIPPFIAALEGRRLTPRTTRLLWASALLWTVLLLLTPWVFADTVSPFHFTWHDRPYPQVDPGPLNELCYLALLAVALWPILKVARHWRQHGPRVHRVVIATALWFVLAAYDGMVGVRWLPTGPMFLLEYGSLLLSLLLFADSVTEHAHLLHAALGERSAAEAAFDRLARGAPDPILMIREGQVAFANTAAAAMVGLGSPRTLIDRPLHHLVHADDLGVFETKPIEDDREKPRSEVPTRTLVRFRREDLSFATAEIALGPVIVGGEDALLAIARDVSEERALRARVMSLDRMIAVGTLAAGVAHEINNPLSYVRASVEMLGESLENLGAKKLDLEAHLQECAPLVEDARHGVERILGIVDDLRVAARTSKDDRLEQQHLSEILAAVLRITRKRLEAKARIETDLQQVPPVMAAPGRLAQVFVNLLTNAADALPEGQADKHRIRLKAYEEDSEAVVIIDDTGPGIAPLELPRIFDPFYTTKSVGQGTGLGLFICQRIVSGCGGKIEAFSEPGEGSRFVVRLPAAPF